MGTQKGHDSWPSLIRGPLSKEDDIVARTGISAFRRESGSPRKAHPEKIDL